MNKFRSPATRTGTLSLLNRGFVPKPRATKTPVPTPAKESSRAAFLSKGVRSTSPDVTGPQSNAAAKMNHPSKFTSKLYTPGPSVVPAHERCGPPGPPGKNGFEPTTTELPYVILRADDNTLHRLMIKKVPGSSPAEYTTHVEQAAYTI